MPADVVVSKLQVAVGAATDEKLLVDDRDLAHPLPAGVRFNEFGGHAMTLLGMKKRSPIKYTVCFQLRTQNRKRIHAFAWIAVCPSIKKAYTNDGSENLK